MANLRARHFDTSAFKLIRIVIASYFMAISLGLIAGVDASQMFRYGFHPDIAALTGSVILFTTSFFLLGGMMMRLMALILAIFVLSSSILQNFLDFHDASIDAFWRDLVLVCAVLLSYGALSPREISRAGILTRSYKVRQINAGDLVLPRRVQSQPSDAPQLRPETLGVMSDLTSSSPEGSDLASPLQEPVENNVFRLWSSPASDPAPAPEASDPPARPAAKAPRHLFAALAARKKAIKNAHAAAALRDGTPNTAAGVKVLDLDNIDDADIDDANFNVFADDIADNVTILKRVGRL